MQGGSKTFFAASLLLPSRVRAPATAWTCWTCTPRISAPT
jgi:phytoene/squalene synthetase